MDIEQGSRVIFNIRGTDLNYWKKHKSTRENVQETNKPLSDLKSKINTNGSKADLMISYWKKPIIVWMRFFVANVNCIILNIFVMGNAGQNI